MLVPIVALLTKLVERFDPDQSERQKAKGRRQKLFVGPPTRLLHSAFCLLTSAFPSYGFSIAAIVASTCSPIF
jgi:hypothetical protein